MFALIMTIATPGMDTDESFILDYNMTAKDCEIALHDFEQNRGAILESKGIFFTCERESI